MKATYVLILLCLFAVRESSVRDELFTVDGKRISKLKSGIVDEHYFWTTKDQMNLNLIESSKEVGLMLGQYFEGEKVRVLLRGGQDCMGYYANFSYCMEAAGLTDKHIANQFLVKRGQPGHEHSASLDYIREKGIQFVFFRHVYDTTSSQIFLKLGGSYGRGEIITRDESMITRMQKKFGNSVIVMDHE